MKKPLLLLACGCLALLVIVVVNQTAQLVGLASTVHPLFGRVVLFALLALYGLTILVPLILLWRLPRPLGDAPPVESPEHAVYLAAFRQRLATNPLLTGVSLNGSEGLAEGLRVLDRHAVDHINSGVSYLPSTTATALTKPPGDGRLLDLAAGWKPSTAATAAN